MHVVHKNRQKKKIFIYIVLIVGVLILWNPFNFLGFLRGVTTTLFLPVNGFGQKVGFSLKENFEVVLHMGDLHEENQMLVRENQELRASLAAFSDVKNENEILRHEAGLSPRDQFDLVQAEVVVRDSLGGDQWVMINKGSRDDITKDMAVVVEGKIFVGYVDLVDYDTSRVRLLTHPDSVVNVANAESGAEAISHGHHGLSVVVKDIKKGDEVKNGDMFVTSQISNRFPRGLGVGTAQNVAISGDELFQSANIMPLVDLGKIHFVSIIKK